MSENARRAYYDCYFENTGHAWYISLKGLYLTYVPNH
jgi:hypothetical protein